MFIKLQSEQITQFWEYIKKGMVESYKIPKDFQLDFAIESLSNLLNGMAQCWAGIHVDDNNTKRLQYTITTKFLAEEHLGNRILLVDSLYSLMPMDKDTILKVCSKLIEFAKLNKCNYIEAIRDDVGVEYMLNDLDFKKHKIIYRKQLI